MAGVCFHHPLKCWADKKKLFNEQIQQFAVSFSVLKLIPSGGESKQFFTRKTNIFHAKVCAKDENALEEHNHVETKKKMLESTTLIFWVHLFEWKRFFELHAHFHWF